DLAVVERIQDLPHPGRKVVAGLADPSRIRALHVHDRAAVVAQAPVDPGQRGADGGPGRRALQLVRGLLEPADEKQLAGTAEERLRDLAARVDLGRGGRVRGRSAALHEVERFGRLLAVIAVLEAAHRLGIERAGLLLLAERRARTPGPVEEARR